MAPAERLDRMFRNLRSQYRCGELKTDENRRRAHIYSMWLDHGVLRKLWLNSHQVAPGVYRSNHPCHGRLTVLKKSGIRTVINLRGRSISPPYLLEQDSCNQLGLTLLDCRLNARRTVPRENLLELIQTFRTAQRPMVMHCKSGADRAGFASAMYLMVIEGRPVEEARRMLSWRYIHFRWTKTGILDHVLDAYAKRQQAGPIGFEEWVSQEYDPEALQAEFRARKWWQRMGFGL